MTYDIRDLESLADYEACVALQEEIWGRGFSERVPIAILRVAQKIGGVSAGAFDTAGTMVGFVFGMTGLRDGALVHWSDMLAVRSEARGSGLAERLKHYQRDKVRALGISVMFWTADPLVARNAQFNVNHLGATPAEYVPNMYGANTGSVLHGAMPTDRFVYRWRLDDAAAHAPLSAGGTGDVAIPRAIHVDADGTPRAATVPEGRELIVNIPHDLSALQASDPSRALAWRLAVREAMLSRLGHGFAVTRFVRGSEAAPPYYVLSPAH